MGCLVEVCRRGGLKVNVDKGKSMALGGEEGNQRRQPQKKTRE